MSPKLLNIISILFVITCTTNASRSSFPEITCWPLCGRISMGTTSCDLNRCGSCLYNDLPIDNSYGPRTQGSSGNRYDWHRGIDIKTDINSSLFAITSGEVEDIKTSSSDGISIQLQHYRSGIIGNCSGGCYFSRYLHASSSVVNIGDWVETGQLIGFSGASSSGNAHLHFELRSAKEDDSESDWQRECIHPLRVLSYCPIDLDMDYYVNIGLVKWNKINVISSRKDLVRFELVLKDINGDIIVKTVPDQYGYNVNSTFLDIEEMNYQYTHKDSSSVSWESFGFNGTHQCPYYTEHGSSYDASLHLDQQSVNNKSVGDFNGLSIYPYNEEDDFWGIVISFVGINEYVESLIECIVVNIYSAEFGTLNDEIVNSTSFGNCITEFTDIHTTDTMYTSTPKDYGSMSNPMHMYWIIIGIVSWIWIAFG